MRNALMIALALTSINAFAGEKLSANKELRRTAIEACKAEGKVKKDLKACVKERINQQQHTTPSATK